MSLNNNKFDALGSHSEDEEEETFIEDKKREVSLVIMIFLF